MSLPIPSDDSDPKAYARKVPTLSRGPGARVGPPEFRRLGTLARLLQPRISASTIFRKVSRTCDATLVRFEQAAPDVAAVDLARPVDLSHGRVGPFERPAEIGSQGADGEHPPPRAHQLCPFNGGTGVKDFDPLDDPGAVEPADRLPRPRPAGVAGAGEDHAGRGLAEEREAAGVKTAGRPGGEQGEEVVLLAQQQYLRLRIAEAGVESQPPRTIGGL